MLFLFKTFPFEFSKFFSPLITMICRVRRARSIILETRQDTPAPIENLIMHQNKTDNLKYLIIVPLQYESFNTKPCLSFTINPLNPELNPICYLLALLGAHHFLHVSRIRDKILTFRRLMSYIYGTPILGVSRSHTTTHHSR